MYTESWESCHVQTTDRGAGRVEHLLGSRLDGDHIEFAQERVLGVLCAARVGRGRGRGKEEGRRKQGEREGVGGGRAIVNSLIVKSGVKGESNRVGGGGVTECTQRTEWKEGGSTTDNSVGGATIFEDNRAAPEGAYGGRCSQRITCRS